MTEVLKVPSTKAKAHFGQLEERVEKGDVAVMDHGRRKFMVVAPKRYDALLAVERVGKDRLRQLDEQFEALVAGMQGETHAAAVAGLGALPLSQILARGAGQVEPQEAVARARVRRTSRMRKVPRG